MAGLKGILRLQWISYWRRISRGGTGAKNSLIVLGLIAIGGFAKYAGVLKTVAAQTHKGQFFELDLLAAAICALCVSPVWDGGNTSMGARELSRFPLTVRERLIARIWGGLVSPICWIAALFSITILWPLAVSPHPVCAVLAGLAFLCASIMSGFAARHFLETSVGSRIGRIAMAVLIAAGAILWLQFGREIAMGLNYLPPHLVIQAASGNWFACGTLIALAVAATLAARHSLVWMLERSPAAVSRRTVSSTRMTVFRKDLRYFRRAETMLWLVLLGLVFYLATAQAPEPDAVRAVLTFTSILAIAVVMNSFGMDGPQGLDRYGLWPLGGHAILSTKNRALAILAGARWGPVLALSFWRFGWREGLYDSMEAASLLLASLALGNATSVRRPHVGEEEPSIVDQVFGLAASGLPGAFTIAILRGDSASAPYAMAGMLGICALLYVLGLRWGSRYYARSFDQMHERLS